MDHPLQDVQLAASESNTDEEDTYEKADPTRIRYEAEREVAQTALEMAIQSGNMINLRAAVTRGRRFRLPGLEEAAKILRKAEKKHTKAQKSERRRGDGESSRPAPATHMKTEKKTKKMDFYVEKQRKDLCRMHALNAFFQRAKLSEDSFQQMCREFEKSANASRGSGDFFFVESDGANILSYVVERDRRYRTVYYAPGTLAEIDDYDETLIGYFEFDNGHVRPRHPPF